jgi:hypothetical protein
LLCGGLVRLQDKAVPDLLLLDYLLCASNWMGVALLLASGSRATLILRLTKTG